MTAPTSTSRPVRVPLSTRVVGKTEVTPHLIRLVLGGGDLARFEPSTATDSYVKLVFEGATSEDRKLRTYTVRSWNAERRELTLDIVTHGAEGLAGPWVLAARPGDPVALLGPGGGYMPDGSAARHLLIGDESALPAIAVALERLRVDAQVTAIVEVDGPADEQSLALPVRWVHRATAPVGERLLAVARAEAAPDPRTHAFVHGEAGFVRELRGWLRDSGVPREQVSVSGYWRAGADDEVWRAVKREFDRD